MSTHGEHGISGDNGMPEDMKLAIKLADERVALTHLLNDAEAQKGSDRYLFIRDKITKQQIVEIRKDPSLYQRFQVLKEEATQAWNHDHKVPTMYEVDRAITVGFDYLLKIIKAGNDDVADILTQMAVAINNIEEKVGIEKTKFFNEPEIANLVKANPPIIDKEISNESTNESGEPQDS